VVPSQDRRKPRKPPIGALTQDAKNAIIRDRIAGRPARDIAKDWLISQNYVWVLTRHVAHLVPKKIPRGKRAAIKAAEKEEQDRAILAKLLAGVPRKKVMAEFGVSRMKLVRVMRQYGDGVVLGYENPLEEEILNAYDACKKPHRVAIQVGVDPKTVYRVIYRRRRLQNAANNNAFLRAAA
jgi:hypothetical protein